MSSFTANGPQGVLDVAAVGLPVFLDLKFHDIPATVAAAVRAVLPLKPFMINVHAQGGPAMMRAAAEAAKESFEGGVDRPLVLAVTVLTSLGGDDLKACGVDDELGPRSSAWPDWPRTAASTGWSVHHSKRPCCGGRWAAISSC